MPRFPAQFGFDSRMVRNQEWRIAGPSVRNLYWNREAGYAARGFDNFQDRKALTVAYIVSTGLLVCKQGIKNKVMGLS